MVLELVLTDWRIDLDAEITKLKSGSLDSVTGVGTVMRTMSDLGMASPKSEVTFQLSLSTGINNSELSSTNGEPPLFRGSITFSEISTP